MLKVPIQYSGKVDCVMELTPQMDREQIKRMGHSLLAFSRLRSLLKMSRQQLADMPKEVLIGCASHEIALVWDKLPPHLQSDIDILKYQYCLEHYSDSGSDVNDGPPPRKLICCYCNMNDINVGADNNIEISSPSTEPETRNPKRKRLSFNCCN